jgi:hypothetical protein
MNAKLRPLPGGGFSQFGQSYHVLDFVYVKPHINDGRYEIAQITKVKAMETPAAISVVYFGWYDSRKKDLSSEEASDEVERCRVIWSNLTFYSPASAFPNIPIGKDFIR